MKRFLKRKTKDIAAGIKLNISYLKAIVFFLNPGMIMLCHTVAVRSNVDGITFMSDNQKYTNCLKLLKRA